MTSDQVTVKRGDSIFAAPCSLNGKMAASLATSGNGRGYTTFL
jgi:hypothetical protein